MIFIVLYLFSVVTALGMGVLAGVSDYKGMTIPNYFSLIILAAFFICYGAVSLAGLDVMGPLKGHLISGAGTLAITYLMFSFKAIGGGDSKLTTAFAFWFTYKTLVIFLFYMMLAGAVLGAVALFLKNKKPVATPPEGSWVARVQGGESVVPYGIPIALGAVVGFVMTGLLTPDTLSLFLMPN